MKKVICFLLAGLFMGACIEDESSDDKDDFTPPNTEGVSSIIIENRSGIPVNVWIDDEPVGRVEADRDLRTMEYPVQSGYRLVRIATDNPTEIRNDRVNGVWVYDQAPTKIKVWSYKNGIKVQIMNKVGGCC